MKTERGTLTRTKTKGPALFFSKVEGKDTAAQVAIVPGYADYADRYEHVQRAWADRGVSSVAVDLRGHGLAEGARGACLRWEEYLDDVEELFTQLDSSRPTFLFGHSFGGLVAASWALRKPAAQKGVLLSNPYMRVALPVPAAKKAIGKAVAALLPGLGLATGIQGHQLTHDEARAKKYDTDPLVFKKANVRWFVESEREQGRVMSRAKELGIPFYLVLGTADPVVAGGRELYEAVGSKDKTLDTREGLLHEVLNEPEWPAVAGAMADWILAHTK